MNAESLTKALGGRWRGSYGTARCPPVTMTTPPLSRCPRGRTASFWSSATPVATKALYGAPCKTSDTLSGTTIDQHDDRVPGAHRDPSRAWSHRRTKATPSRFGTSPAPPTAR